MRVHIVYAIAHYSYGDNDPQTGWYIERITFAAGAGGTDLTILDKKPVAKFLASDDVFTMDIALKDGTKVLPRDSTRVDLLRTVRDI